MFSVAIVASALSVVSAYSKCSPDDVKGPITIPLTKVLSTSPIEISGSIEIIDGCTFKVTGFTFYNARTARWYGGIGSAGDAITLSDATVNPSAGKGEQTFKFRDVVGAPVSFRDFNQFRLFDEESQVVIATAEVPSDLAVRPGTGSNTNPLSKNGNASSGPLGKFEILPLVLMILSVL
jgi:hypothetical protein